MAKAHETAHKGHRQLTPEEKARRKEAIENGDAAAGGGPIESFDARVERGARAVSPVMIDYDRDGYPDAIVGRSGRRYPNRPKLRNVGVPQVATKGQRGGGYSTAYTVGGDGYRQNQIGYRDRLRARVEVMNILAEMDEDEIAKADPRLRAMANMTVPTHSGTGIAGGVPVVRAVTPVVTPRGSRVVTALEQAKMAPKTMRTVSARTPDGHFQPEAPGGSAGAPVTPPSAGGGITGAFGLPRRASFGSVPAQGTVHPDGSFVEPPRLQTEGEAEKKEAAAKQAEHHAKPAEHHAKPAEHHAKPAEHHAKPAEHHARSPETHRPPEHKPPEHKK
jgi:hypothetical protein